MYFPDLFSYVESCGMVDSKKGIKKVHHAEKL